LIQLVLVPLVVLGFLALRKRGIEPSATAKIGIGLVLQLLPCALLLRGVVNMPEGLPLGGWLLGARLAGALPSLLLLPLMLSVLAQLVPARRHGALFGLWSLLTAVMSWLGGHLAA
jgi:POT family proton-dependent oligopeptide transporter